MSTLPVVLNNLDGTETLVEDCYRNHGPVIPKGTVSNGANIPWLLRRFWPKWGCWYDRAVMGHDWRYLTQGCSRKEADMELRKNMEADSNVVLLKYEKQTTVLKVWTKTLPFTIWSSVTCMVFYWGVRLGGLPCWKKRAKNPHSLG